MTTKVKKRWGSKGNNKDKDIGKNNGLKMKKGIGLGMT